MLLDAIAVKIRVYWRADKPAARACQNTAPRIRIACLNSSGSAYQFTNPKRSTMATAKKTSTPVKKTAKAAPAAKKVAPVATKPAAVAIKPIKTVFNKTTLIAHLVEQSGVEPKAAKAVFAALETAILGSVHKKGSGEFTLPGLMKIGLQQVPAKKKRFGKDPFTGEERWFPAKPASVKIKTRALKKLKDATL